MALQLTVSHVETIMAAAERGDWGPFVNAVDPNVKWLIGSPTKDKIRKTGIYNLEEWKSDVNKDVFGRLVGGAAEMKAECIEVIGQKAIIEASAASTQKNGRPYNQRYCWIMIFSSETGKVVEIREYLNTALVQEVMENNAL